MTDTMERTYEQAIQPVIPMKQTDTYQPIQNKDFLEMLDDVVDDMGLRLTNRRLSEARGRQRLFGIWEIEGYDHFDEQVKLMLGARNSFDGSMSAGICFGSQVIVCSNLIFTGYAGEDGIVGKTSHMHVIKAGETSLVPRLKTRFEESLAQIDGFKRFQSRFYEKLRDTKISTNKGYGVIIEATRQNLIPKKDILTIADEWREPSHEQFHRRNAWSLHNSFTEYFKGPVERNSVEAHQRLISLTKFFHKTFVN